MSISNYGELQLLGALPALYVKLHKGDPGEDGANNAATEATRKSVGLNAAVAGQRVSNTDAAWTNVAASETYSHISLWDADTAGHCYWYGPLTSPVAVSAGDSFTIPSGSLTLTLD